MTDAEKLLRRAFAAHEIELDSSTESDIFARIAASVRGDQGEGGAGPGDDPQGQGSGPGSAGGALPAGDEGEEPDGSAAPFGRPYLVESPTWTPGELSFSPETPRRRRIWLGGAAAGIVLATSVAVATIGMPGLERIVGTVIGPQPTFTSMPSPTPTPTLGPAIDLPDTPGPMTREQSATVLAAVDSAFELRGATLRVSFQTAPDPGDPVAPEGDIPPRVYELDAREPSRIRLQRVGDMIHIGGRHWVREGGDDADGKFREAWVEWPGEEKLPAVGKGVSLLALQWEYIWLGDPQIIGLDLNNGDADVIGPQSVDGIDTVQYRFGVYLTSGPDEPYPPHTLDIWVARDGRIVQGRFGDTIGGDFTSDIEYGADVSIKPPPPADVQLVDTGE